MKMDRSTVPMFGSLRNVSVGFDDFFDQMESWGANAANSTSFPPYNIIRHDTHDYSIELAVAGFAKDDISAVVEDGVLTVSCIPTHAESDSSTFIHRGISSRSWKRSFKLASNVEVVSAEHNNGIIRFKLVLNVPDEKKPRTVAIR